MSVPAVSALAAALRVQLTPDSALILAGLNPVPTPSDKAVRAQETKGAPEAQKPNPPPAAQAVETARQSDALRQAGIGPLMADLEQALKSEALPARVREAAAKVVALQTPIDAKVTPETVRRAVSQSGLFLEPRLAAGAAAPPPDLKSALLVLRQVLRAAAPPVPASPPQAQPPVNAAPVIASTTAVPQTPAATPAAAAQVPAAPAAAGPGPGLEPGLAKTYAPSAVRLPQIDPARPTGVVAPVRGAAGTPAAQPALVPAGPQTVSGTSPASIPLATTAPAPAGLPATLPGTPQALTNALPPVIGQTPASPAPPPAGQLPASASPAGPNALVPPVTVAAGATAPPALPVPVDIEARAVGSVATRAKTERPAAAPHEDPPPPPVKGSPIQGQKAAQPHLPADADSAALMRHLERGASGAIARTELFQLASLPDAPRDGDQTTRAHAWLFEVPLATQQGPAVAQFEIEKDGSNGGVTREGAAWRTRFSVDIEPLGLIHALLVLAGGKTTITVWAQRAETLAQLKQDQGNLAGTLDAEVAVYPGRPAAARSSPGRFVDEQS